MKNPQCVEHVHNGGRMVTFHQCERQGWKECDGKWYCKQHHPDTVAERRAEATARYEAERAALRAKWDDERRRNNAWEILKTFGGDDPLATAFEAVYKEGWCKCEERFKDPQKPGLYTSWSASEAKKKLEGMK